MRLALERAPALDPHGSSRPCFAIAVNARDRCAAVLAARQAAGRGR